MSAALEIGAFYFDVLSQEDERSLNYVQRFLEDAGLGLDRSRSQKGLIIFTSRDGNEVARVFQNGNKSLTIQERAVRRFTQNVNDWSLLETYTHDAIVYRLILSSNSKAQPLTL